MRWDWTPACQEASQLLKDAFTSAQPYRPAVVETDPSDYAHRADDTYTLSHSIVVPLRAPSSTTTRTTGNFKTFKIWRHYLESPVHTIDVITDHKNLEYFTSTKMLSRRQARWFRVPL